MDPGDRPHGPAGGGTRLGRVRPRRGGPLPLAEGPEVSGAAIGLSGRVPLNPGLRPPRRRLPDAPRREGFAYLSDRSPVVEFKINPDGGLYLEEWLNRLRDVAGGTLPDERGFKNSRLLDASFERLGPGRLVGLGEKYRAKYVVLPSGSPVEMPVLYRNAGYRLVRLPARPGP